MNELLVHFPATNLRLQIGDRLFTDCGGRFPSSSTRLVEAVGDDWVVVRSSDPGAVPEFAHGPNIHRLLATYCERFGANWFPSGFSPAILDE